jgi:HAD superfamily 5'-nucleotidase-like hydrolase
VSFEQLILPFADTALAAGNRGIAKPRRIFVNRDLPMSGAEWIGFDMDYTLAIYDQPQMDDVSIRATVGKLIARGRPADLAEVRFDPSFSIRGLLIDKRFGHVLKMDRYKVVQRGYHGMRPLPTDEIRALYQSKKIRPTTPRYHWIDTLYALSEATLYAGLVEALDARKQKVDYARLFADVRECIDEAHADGTIKGAVLDDLPKFVRKDPGLAPTLHKFRSAGKKLFLLTNSHWPYTDRMMAYLLNGSMPEYPSWRHYFDVIVVAAQKPAFFEQKRPLVEIGSKVYEGGNLRDLERLLDVTGDRILYVGDHIYGDILRSKKESSWRTAMIVEELEVEIAAHDACAQDLANADDLDEIRAKLEDDLRYQKARVKEVTRQIEAHPQGGGAGAPLAERTRRKKDVDRVRSLLRETDRQSALLRARVEASFHRYWGPLFKEAAETSSFGDQVEEYACVYTSRVSNFHAYSPQQYFRSPRDRMAHEL